MTFRLRRRTTTVLVVVGLLVVVATLAILALPLLKARTEAKAAVSSVQTANADLKAHRFGQAKAAIDDARAHVAVARDNADGFGGDVWSKVPFFGGAVDDARHLIEALDQATVVGDLGIRTYRETTGPHATLVKGDRIDLAELSRLSSLTTRIGPHLHEAQSQLAAVQADAPFVGAKIGSLRDSADSQLASAASSYDRYAPLLQQLPSILGKGQPKSYLVTILNPSEQRYSGGATLSLSTLRVADGRLTFGKSYTVADVDALQPFLRWKRVKGNIFHKPQPTRLTAATFSPWWQVSGEELLRGWKAQTGQSTDGLIAIDLQGLAELFRLTGPVQVAGYGELSADNLVHTLAGSYDVYQDPAQRHALNEAIIPAFRSRLLSGGKFLEKGQSLMASAQGRHFATYFRDRATQQAAQSSGLSGNLSDAPHDYLGVFSQNTNGSKGDYWQQRKVWSTVDLHPDGSARNSVTVRVSNPAPAYPQPTADSKSGYLTRWLGTQVGVFLPRGSRLQSSFEDGQPVPKHLRHPKVPGIYDRPLFTTYWLMAPDATHQLRTTYTVPSAAAVSANGDLSYQLAMDPQDLVTPQLNAVTLRIPSGYRFGTLPEGWKQKDDRTAVLAPTALTRSTTYDVPVLKD